jgi:hypothetical protein
MQLLKQSSGNLRKNTLHHIIGANTMNRDILDGITFGFSMMLVAYILMFL